MNNTSIIDSFTELKSDKMINKIEIMEILDSVFRFEFRKKYDTDENFDIILNPDNGDLEIWQNKIVVQDGEVENHNTEIEISEVLKVESDFEIGEEYPQEFKISELGRRSILSLRQNLKARIKDYENKSTIEKFEDMIGYIFNAEVHHIKRNMVILLDDEGIEICLPKDNQIPGEFYRKGDTISFVVEEAEIRNNKPYIIASRTSSKFLERIMEQEIPEIFDGLINIKNIVRVPGIKAKVAVETYDDRIDPVGTCVGSRGSRIMAVTRELNGESIDIISYTNNMDLYITRSLKPAVVKFIKVEDGKADVHLNGEDIGKAIGKKGSNIRLTSLLTGLEINLINDEQATEEDIDLMEFSDEVDLWVINEFKKAGIDTAKSLLSYGFSELVNMTDLEDVTIEKMIKIIKQEFVDS